LERYLLETRTALAKGLLEVILRKKYAVGRLVLKIDAPVFESSFQVISIDIADHVAYPRKKNI